MDYMRYHLREHHQRLLTRSPLLDLVLVVNTRVQHRRVFGADSKSPD